MIYVKFKHFVQHIWALLLTG